MQNIEVKNGIYVDKVDFLGGKAWKGNFQLISYLSIINS